MIEEPLEIGECKRVGEQQQEQLRVLTYNVWFDNITKERYNCIMEIIEKEDPDFICL